MNLQEVISKLDLNVLTSEKEFSSIIPSCGYASDLLSCVMSNAKHQSVWVTLQAHSNIVAVSTLLDLSAIIITEGATPDVTTIEKANQEGVILLSTNKSTFQVIGELWDMGMRCKSSNEG